MGERTGLDKKSIEIYVATHKRFCNPRIESYIPIEVGAELRSDHTGFICDNTYDNISIKNENYCELTALYWIWKNSTADIVGLCHYRRFFSQSRVNPDYSLLLTEEMIQDYLNHYEAILPEKWIWTNHSVESGYCAGNGRYKDLRILSDVIEQMCPNYINVYNKVLSSKKASYCNMIITSKKRLDNYCSWLFPLLFEVEKRIDLSDYYGDEKRVFGYLAEILMNVWIEKNMIKVKYIPIVNTSNQSWKFKLLGMADMCGITKPLTRIVNCVDLRNHRKNEVTRFRSD